MENSIDKLTAIQNEVGYVKGTINNIALLGLFGEAGEVMDECIFITKGDPIHYKDYDNTPVSLKEKSIEIAKRIDGLKKQIRDKVMPPFEITIENEERFDSEMADALYYFNALAINRGKTLNDYAELSLNKVMKYKTQKDIRHANVEHGAK